MQLYFESSAFLEKNWAPRKEVNRTLDAPVFLHFFFYLVYNII